MTTADESAARAVHPITDTGSLLMAHVRGVGMGALLSRAVEAEDANEVRSEVLHQSGMVIAAAPHRARRRGAAAGHDDAHVRQDFPRQQPVHDVVQIPRVVVVGHRHCHCSSRETERGDAVVVGKGRRTVHVGVERQA